MSRRLLQVHRYASLALAAVWALQAVTGLLLVFHRDLDNAITPGASASLRPAAMGQALDRLSAELGKPVFSIVAADRAGGRFDVFTDGGDLRVARLSGTGETVANGARLAPSDAFDNVLKLHQTLWLGDQGQLLIGLSGVLLLSNMILGLKLAWPRAGGALRALLPRLGLPAPANAHAWHRAVGLWFAAPALILVLAGMTMALGDPVKNDLGAGRPAPKALPPLAGPPSIVFAQGVQLALRRHPQARISVVVLPAPQKPWYMIRMRQRGELQQYFGATAVFVDARNGRILADYDARRAPVQRAAFDSLYPVHTAEFLGWPGRMLAFGVGLWLLTMMTLGVRLWLARRR